MCRKRVGMAEGKCLYGRQCHRGKRGFRGFSREFQSPIKFGNVSSVWNQFGVKWSRISVQGPDKLFGLDSTWGKYAMTFMQPRPE